MTAGASPHAASGPTGAGDYLRDDALRALRHGWGDAYDIGCDSEHGWHARRRDGKGGVITADDADGLWTAVRVDYAARPVPRDLPASAG